MPRTIEYEDRDKEYAKKRNALIPVAEEYANQQFKASFPGGPISARYAYNRKWNLAFHSKMSELCKEKGI